MRQTSVESKSYAAAACVFVFERESRLSNQRSDLFSMHASIAKARMSESKTSFAATTIARTALVALPISFLSLIACESRETCAAKGTHLHLG